jgi:hypothetical protein
MDAAKGRGYLQVTLTWPSVEFLKLRHLVGMLRSKTSPRIEGRHEEGLLFTPRPWLCATCSNSGTPARDRILVGMICRGVFLGPSGRNVASKARITLAKKLRSPRP